MIHTVLALLSPYDKYHDGVLTLMGGKKISLLLVTYNVDYINIYNYDLLLYQNT